MEETKTARKEVRPSHLFPFLLWAVACVTTETSVWETDSPARNEETLDRVFVPMNERATILANRLEVDMSYELFARCHKPGDSPAHQVIRSPGPPIEWTFTAQGQGLYNPVPLRIGQVEFKIVEQAVIRLHRTGPARFELEVRGDVAVARQGQSVRELASLRIENGRWPW